MLVRAFVYLAAVELTRRVGSLRHLLLRASFPATEMRRAEYDASVHHKRAHDYARRLELASRHTPFSAQCLHRSLALYLWLHRDGIESTVKVGVRKLDGQFKAHAWVELGGEVVNDSAQAVAPFSMLSRPGALEALPFGSPPERVFI
jgi:acyl-CoA-binding protein